MPILDFFNCEIVGLSMEDKMRKELCIQAFENACQLQNTRGMSIHSDSLSQYTSYGFWECLT